MSVINVIKLSLISFEHLFYDDFFMTFIFNSRVTKPSPKFSIRYFEVIFLLLKEHSNISRIRRDNSFFFLIVEILLQRTNYSPELH